MEDSHISDMNNGKGNIHLFGVFDGHGGKEVAQYVKKNFTKEFIANKSFKSGNIKKALCENFLRMDELLVTNQGKADLVIEAKKSKEEDERIDKLMGNNKQQDIYSQFVNVKQKEDNEIAYFTGCTATVCLIDETNMYFANAGDSRSVLSKKGVAYPMSIDHKPELDSEKNRIYKADGWVSEGRVKGK